MWTRGFRNHTSSDDSLSGKTIGDRLRMVFPSVADVVFKNDDLSRFNAKTIKLKRSAISFLATPSMTIQMVGKDTDDFATLELLREGRLSVTTANARQTNIQQGSALLVTCRNWRRDTSGCAGLIVRIPRAKIIEALSPLLDTNSITEAATSLKSTGENHATLLGNLSTLRLLSQNNNADSGLYDDLLLSIITLFIARSFQVSHTSPSDPLKILAERALEHINNNIQVGIRVKEIAAALGTSERYLQVAFKSVIGTNPKSFLITDRLNRARADLLRDPALKIADISEKYGYSSPANFSAAFKRQFGIAPQATRTRHRDDELATFS